MSQKEEEHHNPTQPMTMPQAAGNNISAYFLKPPGFKPGQVRGGLLVILTAEHYIHSAWAALLSLQIIGWNRLYKGVANKSQGSSIQVTRVLHIRP